MSALTPDLVAGDGRKQVFSCFGELGDPVEHSDGHQCQLWRAVRQSDIPGEEGERGTGTNRKDGCRQTDRHLPCHVDKMVSLASSWVDTQ